MSLNINETLVQLSKKSYHYCVSFDSNLTLQEHHASKSPRKAAYSDADPNIDMSIGYN